MSEPNARTEHTPDPPDEETIDSPVMEGAAELRAEADAAVQAGDVDLSDPNHGGPSVIEEPVVTE